MINQNLTPKTMAKPEPPISAGVNICFLGRPFGHFPNRAVWVQVPFLRYVDPPEHLRLKAFIEESAKADTPPRRAPFNGIGLVGMASFF